MYHLRSVFPRSVAGATDLQINNQGKLIGFNADIMFQVFSLTTTNIVNTTLVLAREESPADNGQYELFDEGLKMVSRGEAEIALMPYNLFRSLPPNVTILPIVSQGWCRIGSSPLIESAVLSNGPEFALLQMPLILSVGMMLSSLIIVYCPSILKINLANYRISAWYLFEKLMKQNSGTKQKYQPCSSMSMVILIFALTFHILFGCFLNTQRTSITHFDKIDSFEDVKRENVTFITFAFTPCIKILNVAIENHHPLGAEDLEGIGTDDFKYNYCFGTGKCAFLMLHLEYKSLMPVFCTYYSETLLRNPVYNSPYLAYSFASYFFGTRVDRKLILIVTRRTEHLLEMGILQEKGIDSDYYGRQLAQVQPDEECMTKKIENGISSPVSLSNAYFQITFFIYALIVFLAIAIELSHKVFRSHPKDPESPPEYWILNGR
ncbi:uncharacterized protein LOC141852944 [Brevipalpus obovatus]|uniref:uncharacterized protein LOC141852944 n=1 Tax=Brevipalpus obovatus TaxID=246614 RepID=UPI003D9F64F5